MKTNLKCMVFISMLSMLLAPMLNAQDPSQVEVLSLREQERQVKVRIARGERDLDALPLGTCADVLGYRWNVKTRDIELLCRPRTQNDWLIQLGHFVPALRLGDQPEIGMTLLPQDRKHPKTNHVVTAFPEGLRQTMLLDIWTRADYAMKKEAWQHVVKAARGTSKSCSTAMDSVNDFFFAYVTFVSAEPDWTSNFETRDRDFTVWITGADVVLHPGLPSFLMPGAPTTSAATAVDNALADFANDFTGQLATRNVARPYNELLIMFRLFLLGNMLREEEQRIGWDSSFWLSDYELQPFSTPTIFPPYGPKDIVFRCWGAPYSPTEYAAAAKKLTLSGGVLAAYRHYLGQYEQKSTPSPPVMLGSSIIQSTVTTPFYVPPAVLNDFRQYFQAINPFQTAPNLRPCVHGRLPC